VLVHGGRDHCRNWDWVADALRSDWHVIAPDLRGHGDSAFLPEAATPCGVCLRPGAADSPAAACAGHAGRALAGGAIALRYAGSTRRPCPGWWRSRVWAPPPACWPSAPSVTRRASARLDRGAADPRGAAAAAVRVHRTGARAHAGGEPRLTPEQARHLTEHGVSQNEDGSSGGSSTTTSARCRRRDVTQGELEQLWARIECPTLLVYGAESWASNPAEDGRVRHFQTRRCCRSRAPGTGSTTTVWSCSSMPCGGSGLSQIAEVAGPRGRGYRGMRRLWSVWSPNW
jgi:pimeloyl-ACP methyl ester carboxylesterase